MPESESGTAMRIVFPLTSFLSLPSGITIVTLGFVYGVSLMRHSARSVKSPYSFSLHRLLSSLAWLSAAYSITPFTTFQWPPSPSGIFQPARSLPLKSDVKPAGGASWAWSDATPSTATTSRAFVFIVIPFSAADRPCLHRHGVPRVGPAFEIAQVAVHRGPRGAQPEGRVLDLRRLVADRREEVPEVAFGRVLFAGRAPRL